MATPQYAIAQSGFSSMIPANTFSASSYSNEWRSFNPRLKSSAAFPSAEIGNFTVPSFASSGPHEIKDPLLRLNDLISVGEGDSVFSSQEINNNVVIVSKQVAIEAFILYVFEVKRGKD